MYIDFWRPDSWQQSNAAVGEALNLKPGKVQAQLYRGVPHAITEILLGLTRLFPHKREIFYFKGLDPSFEGPLRWLASQGFSLHPLNIKDMVDLTFIDQITIESLCVLYSGDDPLLGRLYNAEAMEAALRTKMVFGIKVSHSRHRYEPLNKNLDKYDIRIMTATPAVSVALLGERANLTSMVASQLAWSVTDVEAALEGIKVRAMDPKLVQAFEQLSFQGGKFFFSKIDARLYDRSVIYWEDMDGSAFIEKLAQDLGLKLGPAGLECRLETTSLSRWGGLKTMDWLLNTGLSPETVRGLVIVSAQIIDDELASRFENVRAQIIRLQTG
jgi:hypothetical protein